MSLFQPTDVTTALRRIARKPTFGAEMNVYVSQEAALLMATGVMQDATTCTYVADAVNALPAGGADLQIVLTTPLPATGTVTVTLTGTDQDDMALTGTATFDPPGYSNNQTYFQSISASRDFKPSVTDKKFKTVTAIACTGGVVDVEYEIYQLPELATFSKVGFTTEKNFTTKSQPGKPIAEDLNGSAATKKGRSEPSTLTLTQKIENFGDGFLRIDGGTFTIMAEVKKEGKVLTDRLFFTNFECKVTPSYPDGDDESTVQIEGFYEQLLIMSAE